MKGFYDKLIALVGVLALAGSGAYFATQQSVGEVNVPTKVPTGADYEVKNADAMMTYKSDWNEPQAPEGAPLELYDVFTPPKIYWHPVEKRFIFETIDPPPPPTPFGLKFVSIEQELYRIQFEAYFEALSGNIKDSSIMLLDNKTNTSFRGKVGDKFPEHNAEIVDFNVVTAMDPETGLINRVPTVTVKDTTSGENITLNAEERRYIPNSYTLNFETLKPYSFKTFIWKNKGDSGSVDDVTFKLLDFAFDNQTATVEKTFSDGETPSETQPLTITTSTPAQETQTVEKPEENSQVGENDSGLDIFF